MDRKKNRLLREGFYSFLVVVTVVVVCDAFTCARYIQVCGRKNYSMIFLSIKNIMTRRREQTTVTTHPDSSSPPPRVNITTFFHQGKVMDYTGRGYSVNHLGVYNKHGKTLGAKKSDVQLTCANGIRTDIGKLRVYHAVLHPLPSAEIEISSGFRAVAYDLPASDPRRYAYETAADRTQLIETNARALPNIWKPLVYTNNSTKFSNYEIHGITGHIRRISKNPLKPNKIRNPTANGRVCLCGTGSSSGSNPTMISPHIAYMCTFKSERRREQTQVDHINGDHGDNSPYNLRWASPAENCLYKFTQQAKRFDGHPAPKTMVLSDLKQFLDTDILCGEARLHPDDSEPMYVIYNTRTKRYRSIGDFLVTTEDPYPRIEINKKTRHVHCLVAFMSGIISYEELETMGTNELVVMHSNNKKEDFRPKNLARGTSSENNFARHDNPQTTSRKRVRSIETLDSGEECVTEYESQTAAARAVNGCNKRISEAIRDKSPYMNMRWEDIERDFGGHGF